MESKGEKCERRSLGGRIPEEVQQQARQKESPVLSEILIAARKGLTQQVVQLLQRDPGSATTTDKHGRTCLHMACIAGHLRTSLAILQSGLLQIDAATKRGHTSLHETCQEGHIHLTLLLISLGASLQARSREGWTPLMCSCSRGHTQLVNIVCAVGGNIDDLTRTGLTPLHIAAWKGHAGVVEALLALRANPAAVTQSGKTALQLAIEEEHSKTISVLQAATDKVSTEPTHQISLLEGQLKLDQNKLKKIQNKSDDSDIQLRDDTIKKLSEELEQEKAKVSLLQTKLNVLKLHGDDETMSTDKRGTEPSPCVFDHIIKEGNSLTKSASVSDISDAVVQPPPTGSSHSIEHTTSEKLSITDMVSECLRNPSSIASIRNNLKEDQLTPRIQRKFRYKTNSAKLPPVPGGVPSPLAQEGAKATRRGSLTPSLSPKQ